MTTTTDTPPTTHTNATPSTDLPPHRLARVLGGLMALLVVCGMTGPLVLESMLVPGDAGATAANIAESSTLFELSLAAWLVIVVLDTVISLLFYLLLAPVSRVLALTAAAFRMVYTVALAALLTDLLRAHQLLTPGTGPVDEAGALAQLEHFSAGFLTALVFFGVHLVLLGLAFHRSGYLPQLLAVLLSLAGVGYIVDSLASLVVDGYGGAMSALALAPALVGELGLMAWLLVKGVRTDR